MSENPTQDVATALNTLGEAIASWARQVFDQIMPAIQQMYAAIYEQYLQAGAPYGDSQEGCLRWMEELAEVRRLEAQAEHIISQHQGLAYLRKQLAEKREEGEQS